MLFKVIHVFRLIFLYYNHKNHYLFVSLMPLKKALLNSFLCLITINISSGYIIICTIIYSTASPLFVLTTYFRVIVNDDVLTEIVVTTQGSTVAQNFQCSLSGCNIPIDYWRTCHNRHKKIHRSFEKIHFYNCVATFNMFSNRNTHPPFTKTLSNITSWNYTRKESDL